MESKAAALRKLKAHFRSSFPSAVIPFIGLKSEMAMRCPADIPALQMAGFVRLSRPNREFHEVTLSLSCEQLRGLLEVRDRLHRHAKAAP